MFNARVGQETDKPVSMTDVYEEINDLINHTFKSRRVQKHFAFSVPGVDVPPTSDYLEVIQSAPNKDIWISSLILTKNILSLW